MSFKLLAISLFFLAAPAPSYAWSIFGDCFSDLEEAATKYAKCHKTALYSNSCQEEKKGMKIAELECTKDKKDYGQINASKTSAFLKQGYEQYVDLSPFEKIISPLNGRAPYYTKATRSNIEVFDKVNCKYLAGKFYRTLNFFYRGVESLHSDIDTKDVSHVFFYQIKDKCQDLDSIDKSFPVISEAQLEKLTQHERVFTYVNKGPAGASFEFYSKREGLVALHLKGRNIKVLNIKPKYKYGMLLKPGKYHISWTDFWGKRKSEWIKLSADIKVYYKSLL